MLLYPFSNRLTDDTAVPELFCSGCRLRRQHETPHRFRDETIFVVVNENRQGLRAGRKRFEVERNAVRAGAIGGVKNFAVDLKIHFRARNVGFDAQNEACGAVRRVGEADFLAVAEHKRQRRARVGQMFGAA